MFVPFSYKAKAWEPHAHKLRAMVQCGKETTRFEPLLLAPRVGLTVQDCTFTGLSESEIAQLSDGNSLSWSGGVYPELLPDGTRLCMLNPLQSPRRSRITLMEEICHCYFSHRPTSLVVNSQGLLVRDFDKKQEEQAYGVGAAVLLPWNLFFPRINKGTALEGLAEEFDVTTQLVEYRIKVTGASALYRSRQLAKSSTPNLRDSTGV
jgi:IrrE N-terminal-like domain